MKVKDEGNIIIAINATKSIIGLFLGPFLTAYFIKTSAESVISLSIYNILCDILLVIGSFIVGLIVKRKFKIGMFRIGVILNFIYVMAIILLRENIVNHLGIISILYGLSSSAYWLTYNMFAVNKVENINRTKYTVKSTTVSSITNIIVPVLLGSMITITNYQLTAIAILVISLIQIILSFILTPIKDNDLPKYNLKKAIRKFAKEEQVRKTLFIEFLSGLTVAGSSGLEAVTTILIFSTFKTDLNLGIITSIASILLIIALHVYGKKYKNKKDKRIIKISSIIPTISLILLLLCRNNITVIIYEFCYIVFAGILKLTYEIRLYNISDSSIITKENQAEFLSIRELFLNSGRMFSFILLLIAGIAKDTLALSIVMILLTVSILLLGIFIPKVDKFEE